MPTAFHPSELLCLLVEHQVRFVVVGGVAGTLLGSPLTTRDLDVVYDTNAENLDRLVEALTRIEARYRDPVGRSIRPDRDKLETIKVNLLQTRLGNLDLLREIGESWSYADLADRTVTVDLGRVSVRVIDLETLIQAKSIANRPKDRMALPYLRDLLSLREEREDP